MTQIERVDIEGFKGIGSLSVDPSAVNIITGRNNTGKTSLLESINLVFDPKSIRHFGSNIDTLINVNFSQAKLVGEFSSGERTVVIQQASYEETRDLLVETLLNAAVNFLGDMAEHQNIDDEILTSIEEEIRTLVIEELSEEIIEKSEDQTILISVDGNEYSLLHPDNSINDLYQNIITNAQDRLAKQEQQIESTNSGIIQSSAFFGFQSTIRTTHFVGEQPMSTGEVTIIDTPDLTERPETEDGEADAVKIDDIEDFLKEKQIVENLRNFDLDYLVFEDDDGEKYSVPYEFMGDGFKAIVGILWKLFAEDVTEQVVLLEEPGINMHPGYIRELVYFLVNIIEEKDLQLFITTHNNDFVSDFFGENLTEDEMSFLSEEFTLIQMQEDTADVMAYEEAEEHLKDLHLDLRGL